MMSQNNPKALLLSKNWFRIGFQLIILLVAALLIVGCSQAMPSSTSTTLPESTETEEPVAIDTKTVEPTATDTGVPVSETVLLVPEGVYREVYYAPFPMAITLDGDLKDWEGVPTVLIPETAELMQGATSVRFAAAAGGDYLYLMGDVTDSKIISGEHGQEFWNEDSLEFYINGTGDLQLPSYVDGVAQITVPPLNIGKSPEEAIVGGVRGESAEAQLIVLKTENGYVVEMAVPLKNRVWNIPMEHGSTIGFQVHLNGASDYNRNLKVIWSIYDQADRSYQDPSLFGQLVFFEIGQSGLESLVQVPTPGPTLVPVPGDAPYKQADLPIEERVADLLARMTLAEKIGQMTLVEKNSILPEDVGEKFIGSLLSGGGGYPEPNTAEAWADMVDGFQEYALNSHLGIPLLYGIDAVHGHNNVYGAVIFPHNVGLGAANDPDLMTRIAQVTAAEMIATGIYWNYAPVVAVPQDIRWGRAYEAYGENTDLVTSLGTAFLHGLQGDDLSDRFTVLATPKHFIGDGGTVWGSSTMGKYQIDQGVTAVDESMLRAIHLPPYIAALDAGAESIMISFSSWGGMKMHAHEYLISDVLKNELGFKGFIVSDWAGIDQIDNDYYLSVVTAINAGIDMNMVPYQYKRFVETLTRAVESGDVSMERIDDAVRRILTVKFTLGLFEQPFSDESLVASVGSEEHRAVAREAVSKSLVLLKNQDDLLPLAKDVPALFIGGRAADDIGVQCGGWTIEWQGKMGAITPGTTILKAIEGTVSPETVIEFNKFGRFEDINTSEDPVCIAVVGEEPYAEGVGDDGDLKLPVDDLRMLRRMIDPCDRLAVILLSGRPLVITDLIEDWDALVAAWLPGTEGQGVVDVLFWGSTV
jgi:beta-glucosidase